MAVVGSVSVRVVPSFSGFQKGIADQFKGVAREAARAGQSSGQSFWRSANQAVAAGGRSIGRVITSAFSYAARGIGRVASAIGSAFMTYVARPIGRGAAALGRTIGSAFATAGRWVAGAARTVGSAFMARLPESIRRGAGAIGNAVSSAFSAAGRGIGRVATAIGGAFTDRIVPALRSGAGRVGNAVSTMFDGARSVAASAGARVADAFSRGMSGIGSTLTQTIAPKLADMGDRVNRFGGQLEGIGGAMTKGITIPAATAVGAVGGLTAALGLGRLIGIDTARAKLQGLGYDAADVERISGMVTDAIEGTMITMAEGTNIAVGALASGVEEGEELERYIRLVGDAANFANVPIEQMSEIFNRVQGSGRLMLGELNMLERQVPGSTAKLAESYGVSQEAFREMVSAGEVDAAHFLDVMDDFLGGAGEAYASSWQGLVKNTGAYIGIIGENILSGAFQQAKDELASFVEFLSSERVQDWAVDTGEKVGRIFTQIVQAIRSAIDWWINLDGATQKWILGIAGAVVAAGPFLLIVGKIITGLGALITSVGAITGWIGSLATRLGIATAGAGSMSGVLTILGRAFSVLMGPVGWIIGGLALLWTSSEKFRESVFNLGRTIWDSLVSAFEMLWPHVQSLLGSLGDLWESLTGGGSLFETVGNLASYLVDGLGWLLGVVINLAGGILTGLVIALDYLVQGFTWVVGIVTGALSSAMSWLMDVGFPAVGRAAVWLYENALLPAWNGIRSAISATVAWVQTTGWPILQTVFSTLGSIGIWLWQNVLVPAFSAIQTAFSVLATAIGWAWSNIIQPAFRVFGSVVSWLWHNVAIPAFRFIGAAFEALGSAIGWVWSNILQPTFRFIGSVISWLWTNVAQPTFAWIGRAFGTLGSVISGIWTGVLQPVFRFVGSIISWLWENVAKPYFASIARGWSRMVEGIKWWWQQVLAPTFRLVRDIIVYLWHNVALPAFAAIRRAWSNMSDRIREIWRSFLRPMFQNVRDFVVNTYRNHLRPTFGWIRDRWNWLKDAFIRIWRSNLRPMFQNVRDFIRSTYRNHIRPVFGWIRDRWNWLKDAFVRIWRNNIRPMFQALRDFVRNTYRNHLRPTFNWIRDRWNWLKDRFIAIWRNSIRPMFQNVRDFIKNTYRNHIRPAFNWIRDRWNWLRERLRDIWRNRIRPIFQAVGDFVKNDLVDRIKEGVDLIKNAWEKVKEWFAKPIIWVIDTVWNDGIRKAFNRVASAVGSDETLSKISTDKIGAYAKGGRAPKGWALVGEEGPELVNFSNPGRVYTADETQKMLADQAAGKTDPIPQSMVDKISAGGTEWPSDSFPMGGANWDDWREGRHTLGATTTAKQRSAWDEAKNLLGKAGEWIAGGLRAVAERALNPLKDLAKSHLSVFGGTGTLAFDAVKWGIDKLLGFGQEKDDEHNASLEGGGGQGLSGIEAMMWAIRQVESNQNYTAANPSSSARGAYQFIRSTWGNYGGYSQAHLAPKSVQDAKARENLTRYWNQYGNWSQVAAAWLSPYHASRMGSWGTVIGSNPSVQGYVNRVMAAFRTAQAPKDGGAFSANPGGWNRPATGPVTSWAGPRNFALGYSNYHHGVDIGAPQGAAVRAAWSGRVKRAGWGPGNLGNIIIIDHGAQDSLYAHLSSIGAKVGEEVTGGRRIGGVGATGGPFRPHLHFEVHRPNWYAPTNPNHLFRDKGGLLPEGYSTVLNKTGGAEYVYNQRQFDNLNAMAEQLSGSQAGPGLVVHQHGVNHDNAKANADAFMRAKRRMDRGGAYVS